jgi:hypothetical protein
MNTAKTPALIVRVARGEARTYPLNNVLGKDGLRVPAVPDARYELVDLASGFAPDTVRVMRKGQDLLVFFDGEALARLTIEGHYAALQPATSILVGKNEAGHYYAFVPETAAWSESVNALADRPVTYGMALGGGILPAVVPISPESPTAVGAAAGTSLGGLLPLVGGLAALGLVAAASKSKGSGSGSADQGPKSNVEAGLALTLVTDVNNDGQISAAELPSTAPSTTVRATFDQSKVRVGDALVFAATNGDVALQSQTHVLTAQDIGAGQVSVQFARPAELQTQRVEVNFVNLSSGPATDAKPFDSALRAWLGPKSNAEAGLALTLLTDANNDGWVNLGEMGSAAVTTVQASFDNSKVREGDRLVFSASNGDSALQAQTRMLTAQNILDGRVEATFTRPQEGQTQRVQVNFVNQTEGAATDSVPFDLAKLDTLPIGLLTGSYTADGNNVVSQITFNPSAVEAGRYSLKVGAIAFEGALSGVGLLADPIHQIRQNFLSAQTTAKGSAVYLELWDAAGNASSRAYAFNAVLDEVVFTFNNNTYFVL